MSRRPDFSGWSVATLMKHYAHQLRYQRPLLPGVAPDGNRVQMLKGVEVALIHGLLLVEINLADKVAVIAAHYIRIVFGHGAEVV